MVLQVGTKNHYLFSAGEQCRIEIQLDPIRLTALVVGLVRLEQEVRAEGRRLTFSDVQWIQSQEIIHLHLHHVQVLCVHHLLAALADPLQREGRPLHIG